MSCGHEFFMLVHVVSLPVLDEISCLGHPRSNSVNCGVNMRAEVPVSLPFLVTIHILLFHGVQHVHK
jgi:hypothetical protein